MLFRSAYQAPPSMGFSRQEDSSGVPLPSPSLNTNLIKKQSLLQSYSPHIHAHFLCSSSQQKVSETVYTAPLSSDSSAPKGSTYLEGSHRVPVSIRVTEPLVPAHLPQPLSSMCHSRSPPLCCAVFFWLLLGCLFP